MALKLQDLASPNADARPGGIDMLILHYTGMKSAGDALDRLRDPLSKVSSHYVVDEDGAVFCLVDEQMRAYHAGISFWRGRTALNDVSIGIEIVNPGHEWGYRHFPAAQMDAVMELCTGILARHTIPAHNVVGHSDVAPNRKQDPGELFPWKMLAENGIGVWPKAASAGCGPIRPALAEIGYDAAREDDDDTELATILRAFQRHWRQDIISGVADAGTLDQIFAVRDTMRHG